MLGQDATVRKSLLGLFGWYIPANPYSLLQPHLPLLLLQTSSALSNIFPEIRLDAAKLVHLLLQHVPSQVTAGWPAASLDCASSSKAALDGASSGESTILEGLRLALGLGGEKATSAQNRMSAGEAGHPKGATGFRDCRAARGIERRGRGDSNFAQGYIRYLEAIWGEGVQESREGASSRGTRLV